ncbi:MAG: serine/threonine protein kinase, partial [Deltaproteobacteria bacterium]|nr:serine/threonine protein kinase [Deltaproteobacteria bacterium]
KYKILHPIGNGAMGSIYKAEHMTLEKVICLKVLHKHLVKDESHIKRFHREARAASRLSHPNCIGIMDYGQTDDGLTFIAMEYISGEDLATTLHKEVRLPPERALRIAIQICEALDEAHSKGVVHRDMKPENIMLEHKRLEPDFVKVLDFGIAKIRDSSGSSGSFHTATGLVFGTPEYMSPEQIKGEDLDGKSDIYSLGIVLYQMLCGKLPFEGESVLEIATQHLTAKPPPVEKFNPDLPREICHAVMALLSKKKDERPSAIELRETLCKLQDGLKERAATKKDSRIKNAKDVFSKTTEKTAIPKDLMEEMISDRTMIYQTPDFDKASREKQRISGFRHKEPSGEHAAAENGSEPAFPEIDQFEKRQRKFYLLLFAVVALLLAGAGIFLLSYLL